MHYNTLESDLSPDPHRIPLQPFTRLTPMADQQLELIRELNRAYEQMSVLALSDLLYPDYIHVTRPNSLNIPDRNKTQYLEYFENMFSNWTSVGPVSCFLNRQPNLFHPTLNSHVDGLRDPCKRSRENRCSRSYREHLKRHRDRLLIDVPHRLPVM